jgi:acyl-CoA synthetase (AMP-forming)/AMP-acid ligase II
MNRILQVDERPYLCASLVEMLYFFIENNAQLTPFTYIDYSTNKIKDKPISYCELDRQARRIATLLQIRGKVGDRVLLLYPAGVEYLYAFFGCLYAGMVAVPVYPPLNARLQYRLAKIAEDCQANIALSTAEIIFAQTTATDLPTYFERIFWLNTEENLDGYEHLWQDKVIGTRDLAFLQYTSGSTGNPKGVMVTHGNIVHNLKLIATHLQFEPNDHHFSWLPPYHDMGLIGALLGSFASGVPVSFMAPASFLRRPVRWLQEISDRKCTISGAPNFAYELCLNKISDEERDNLDLSSWTLAFSGAEPVRQHTLLNFTTKFSPVGFREKAFYPCYGMAETTLLVSGVGRNQGAKVIEVSEKISEDLPGSFDKSFSKNNFVISCGTIATDLDVKIVDPETLAILPDGQAGEIIVSGDSVTVGYWGAQDKTAQCYNLIIDGSEQLYFRTEDLGYIINGELIVCGRINDLIIIRGVNFYPHDIEDIVSKCHKDIRVGSGIAISIDFENEEKLIFIQEINQNIATPLGEVIIAIHSAISTEFNIQPMSIILIKNGTIPKTTSGKLSRRPCREAYQTQNLEVIQKWTNPLVIK